MLDNLQFDDRMPFKMLVERLNRGNVVGFGGLPPVSMPHPRVPRSKFNLSSIVGTNSNLIATLICVSSSAVPNSEGDHSLE